MLPNPPLTSQLPGLQTRDVGAPGWRRSLSALDGGRVWRSLHLPVPCWSLGSPPFLLLPTLPSVVCLDVTVAAA